MQRVAPFDFREYFLRDLAPRVMVKVFDEKIPGYTLWPEGSF